MVRNNAVHLGGHNVCELLMQGVGEEEHWTIDPMLRSADRKHVSDVLYALKDDNIKPYVSGGVFNNHVFGGEYGDVDILGVFKNVTDAYEFRRRFDTGQRVAPVNHADPVYEATIGGTKFLVRDHRMRKAYFGILGVEDVAMHFTLTPVVEGIEAMWRRSRWGQEKSQIELGLTSVEHFEKSFGSDVV